MNTENLFDKLQLGTGRPKICIPIVGKNIKEICAQAKNLLDYPADLVEWRADWFEGLLEVDQVLEALKELRKILGDLPLLFTIRTALEGGEVEITPADYQRLNVAVAKSGLVDLVDVEVYQKSVSNWDKDFDWDKKEQLDPGQVADVYVRPDTIPLVQDLQKTGVAVIGSSHDFEKTPEKEVMLASLRAMQKIGVDICKLAVMPRKKEDVAALLTATEEMKRNYANRPLITMSMGQMGLVSRLAGETFGSCVTFGAAGRPSAPGQIGADRLLECLELLHGPELKEKETKEHIFLIGFMGAGKSTISNALKEISGQKQIEMDALIEQEAGQTIASIFEQYGEDEFRRRETEVLYALAKEPASVISCGGGIVVRAENTKFMKGHGKIVLLTATPETVFERIKDTGDRPVLKGRMNVEYIRELQEKRRELYESVADIKIATDGKTVQEICEEILDALK